MLPFELPAGLTSRVKGTVQRLRGGVTQRSGDRAGSGLVWLGCRLNVLFVVMETAEVWCQGVRRHEDKTNTLCKEETPEAC